MSILYDEAQQAIAEGARRVLDARGPTRRGCSPCSKRTGEWDESVLDTAREQGWTALAMPEALRRAWSRSDRTGAGRAGGGRSDRRGAVPDDELASLTVAAGERGRGGGRRAGCHGSLGRGDRRGGLRRGRGPLPDVPGSALCRWSADRREARRHRRPRGGLRGGLGGGRWRSRRWCWSSLPASRGGRLTVSTTAGFSPTLTSPPLRRRC